MIEAANPEEEALAIAVTLREALDTPGKTAALVTPDRALARRVVAALERWHVAADDSGGDPLPRYARRSLRAAGRRGALGRAQAGAAAGAAQASAAAARRKRRRAQCARLPRWSAPCCAARGRSPAARRSCACAGQRSARKAARMMHRSDPRGLIAPEELDAAAALIEKLTIALAPLETIQRRRPRLGGAGGMPSRRHRQPGPQRRRRHRGLRRQ